MRTCSACRAEKPETDFYYRRNGRPNGNRCRRCVITANNAYQAANRPRATEMQRRWKLEHRYSITSGQYSQMMDDQGGLCGICGHQLQGGRLQRLVVDHDHTSGEVRGLLCDTCNKGLGLIGDTLESLDRAIAYLVAFEERS